MSYRKKRFLFIPIILVAIAAFGAVAMLLWNVLMPHIFHLPIINYWQAMGLLILARLFFGGGRPHHHGPWHSFPWKHSIRDKVANMTPEERRDFFRKLHEYRHFRHEGFWERGAGKETPEEK